MFSVFYSYPVFLIKVILYSIAYTLFLIILLKAIATATGNKRLKRVASFSFPIGMFLSICFAISFIVYSNSYWQDSGIGDSYKIPFGNGYTVNNIGENDSYFHDYNGDAGKQAFISEFKITKGILCAKFYGFNAFNCAECFLVFDSHLKKMIIFESEREYTNYAKSNQLPLTGEFESFSIVYNEYWSKQKKWYLPQL